MVNSNVTMLLFMTISYPPRINGGVEEQLANS
jgi:hypothetical protein